MALWLRGLIGSSSQHLHGGSQSSVTPVPKDPVPPICIPRDCTHMVHMQRVMADFKAQVCNPCRWEVKARGGGDQEFKGTLKHLRLQLKQTKAISYPS